MLARVRYALVRHRWVHRGAVVLLALVPGVVVHHQLREVAASRDAWGPDRVVLVTVHELPAGHRLSDADVRRVRWPAAVVPDGALSDLGPGAVTATPFAAGEPLVPSRLGLPGRSALRALLGDGQRAVAVPRGDVPVEPGDVVDVVAAQEPSAAVVAHGARVLAVTEAAAVVAVDAAEVGPVVAALAASAAVLVLA